MEFYEAVDRRRTVREWTDEDVSAEVLERIISAGMKAPTHNHRRDWEFIILHTPQEKETALQFVKAWSVTQEENKIISSMASAAQKMYAYAMPRQYTMLASAPYVIIPLFPGGDRIFRAAAVNGLNSFATAWCVVENIFLAAAAEGLGYAMRIPVGEEGRNVTSALGVPDGYIMPCYIGIGHALETAYTVEQMRREVKSALHYGRF